MINLRPIDLTFGAVFVCLMAIGANISIWFPFLTIPIGGASVPLSLQTFFALLAGLILGKKLGAITMITYMLIGIAGLPVFAGLKAGPMVLISPTGGFIISYIFVTFFVGLIAERSKNNSIYVYVTACIIGLVFNYGIGISYMWLAMNTWLELNISYAFAWVGMFPFLIKDTALACLSASFMVNIAKRIPARWLEAGI
ncbi:biotin transport system substrate-specific component [Virgibacillus natechei]|uniref:Biotin transporter n=1 Tax=Virgibacillus natechei TaxID=1216297 RepID=A0ABS4IGF8_9BACI|nr:biotin transporter BioY [Virgibacillus natechei]MBP1969536.1 biotin transport system substrate-specific component [Virgibacillus natechei]UZD11763.1 biotin transporter BioY [Virgibacillus natechei]